MSAQGVDPASKPEGQTPGSEGKGNGKKGFPGSGLVSRVLTTGKRFSPQNVKAGLQDLGRKVVIFATEDPNATRVSPIRAVIPSLGYEVEPQTLIQLPQDPCEQAVELTLPPGAAAHNQEPLAAAQSTPADLDINDPKVRNTPIIALAEADVQRSERDVPEFVSQFWEHAGYTQPRRIYPNTFGRHPALDAHPDVAAGNFHCAAEKLTSEDGKRLLLDTVATVAKWREDDQVVEVATRIATSDDEMISAILAQATPQEKLAILKRKTEATILGARNDSTFPGVLATIWRRVDNYVLKEGLPAMDALLFENYSSIERALGVYLDTCRRLEESGLDIHQLAEELRVSRSRDARRQMELYSHMGPILRGLYLDLNGYSNEVLATKGDPRANSGLSEYVWNKKLEALDQMRIAYNFFAKQC